MAKILNNDTSATEREKIKQLIAAKGVTKQKVAERCGIHISTLSKFLNGHPITQLRPEKVARIREYLEAINTNEI